MKTTKKTENCTTCKNKTWCSLRIEKNDDSTKCNNPDTEAKHFIYDAYMDEILNGFNGLTGNKPLFKPEEKITLREYIAKNELNPERNNDLEWYEPDESIFVEEITLDNQPVYIFRHQETGVRCAIADIAISTHGTLLGENELENMLSNIGRG